MNGVQPIGGGANNAFKYLLGNSTLPGANSLPIRYRGKTPLQCFRALKKAIQDIKNDQKNSPFAPVSPTTIQILAGTIIEIPEDISLPTNTSLEVFGGGTYTLTGSGAGFRTITISTGSLGNPFFFSKKLTIDSANFDGTTTPILLKNTATATGSISSVQNCVFVDSTYRIEFASARNIHTILGSTFVSPVALNSIEIIGNPGSTQAGEFHEVLIENNNLLVSNQNMIYVEHKSGGMDIGLTNNAMAFINTLWHITDSSDGDLKITERGNDFGYGSSGVATHINYEAQKTKVFQQRFAFDSDTNILHDGSASLVDFNNPLTGPVSNASFSITYRGDIKSLATVIPVFQFTSASGFDVFAKLNIFSPILEFDSLTSDVVAVDDQTDNFRVLFNNVFGSGSGMNAILDGTNVGKPNLYGTFNNFTAGAPANQLAGSAQGIAVATWF